MLFWALIIFAMLGSAFDPDPATDPHGYGIVFGVLISVPLSLFQALLLPFTAPRRWWSRAFTDLVADVHCGDGASCSGR